MSLYSIDQHSENDELTSALTSRMLTGGLERWLRLRDSRSSSRSSAMLTSSLSMQSEAEERTSCILVLQYSDLEWFAAAVPTRVDLTFSLVRLTRRSDSEPLAAFAAVERCDERDHVCFREDLVQYDCNMWLSMSH